MPPIPDSDAAAMTEEVRAAVEKGGSHALNPFTANFLSSIHPGQTES